MKAVYYAQDMIYTRRILTSLDLRLKLPILLDIDSKGTFYLINNWIVGGRTKHFKTFPLFLRDIKKQLFPGDMDKW